MGLGKSFNAQMLAFVGSPAGAAGNTKSTGGFPDGTPCDPGCKAGPIYGKLGAWVSSGAPTPLTTKPCKSAAPSIRRRSTAPAPRRVQPSCLACTPVATSWLEVNASGAPKQHTN